MKHCPLRLCYRSAVHFLPQRNNLRSSDTPQYGSLPQNIFLLFHNSQDAPHRGLKRLQCAVTHSYVQDAALRNGDGAVEQELEERHLDQQAGAGQRHHAVVFWSPMPRMTAYSGASTHRARLPERRTAERFQRSRSSAVRKIRCRTNPTLSRTPATGCGAPEQTGAAPAHRRGTIEPAVPRSPDTAHDSVWWRAVRPEGTPVRQTG